METTVISGLLWLTKQLPYPITKPSHIGQDKSKHACQLGTEWGSLAHTSQQDWGGLLEATSSRYYCKYMEPGVCKNVCQLFSLLYTWSNIFQHTLYKKCYQTLFVVTEERQKQTGMNVHHTDVQLIRLPNLDNLSILSSKLDLVVRNWLIVNFLINE